MAHASHAPWPICKQACAFRQGGLHTPRLCPAVMLLSHVAQALAAVTNAGFPLCRYQLTYSITDSSGTAAVPLILKVNIYESGQVQASLLLISQAPNASAAAAWAAAIPHTNYSGNAALRSALTGSLSAWLAGVGPATAVAEAATTVFDSVDPFAYSAVQQSNVALLNATLLQNLSSYIMSNSSNSSDSVTSSSNFAVLVAMQVIVNSTAYATTVTSGSSRRRELLVQAEPGTDVTLAATHSRALMSTAAGAGRPQRRQLQADTSSIVFALDLKLQLLINAFQSVLSCNASAITSLYYEGVAPLFLAGSCSTGNNTAQSSSNFAALNAYLLQAASVTSNQLPPYQVLQITGTPVAARITPFVDSALAEQAAVIGAIQLLAQQTASGSASITALSVAAVSQAQKAAAARLVTLQDLAALSAASSASEDASVSNVQATFNLISSAAPTYSFSSVSVSMSLICSDKSSVATSSVIPMTLCTASLSCLFVCRQLSSPCGTHWPACRRRFRAYKLLHLQLRWLHSQATLVQGLMARGNTTFRSGYNASAATQFVGLHSAW